jgi:adenosylcobinamide-phosphate synthase
LGAAFDAALGDPERWPHPVRAIGKLIEWAESAARKGVARLRGGPRTERVVGGALACGVVSVTVAAVGAIVWSCEQLGDLPGLFGGAILVYWGLAARSLGDAGLAVARAPDLDAARRALARIVGRDTSTLDAAGVTRACVETIAENSNDGVVAPLFWYALAGPMGMWAYKAINTLDSMVGYRNARYERLGWASARLDDLAGLVPARLTWLLITASSALVGERARAALLIGWRDGRKHESPNAAWGEAAMAGALGVQLGGPASYEGLVTCKPFLGEPDQTMGTNAIRRAVRLLYVTTAIAVVLAWACRVAVLGAA